MDLILLTRKIAEAVSSIDFGRKGFAIIGKEREGRIAYEDGIAEASAIFKEVLATVNPKTVISAEYAFITQEFQLSDKSDTDTLVSLTKAIESFRDAFRALNTVEDRARYQAAEETYPHDKKYRVKGYPKDAFHTACISHQTRLKNILRTPGLDPIEKALLKQRLANLPAAQNAYVEKQKKALEK